MNGASVSVEPQRSLAAAARGRLLLWCAALVLLCQLFGGIGHDHKKEKENEAWAQDCVACSVHAQAPAAPPAPSLGASAFVPFFLHALALPTVAARPVSRTGYLLPQPHAPPAPRFSA